MRGELDGAVGAGWGDRVPSRALGMKFRYMEGWLQGVPHSRTIWLMEAKILSMENWRREVMACRTGFSSSRVATVVEGVRGGGSWREVMMGRAWYMRFGSAAAESCGGWKKSGVVVVLTSNTTGSGAMARHSTGTPGMANGSGEGSRWTGAGVGKASVSTTKRERGARRFGAAGVSG